MVTTAAPPEARWQSLIALLPSGDRSKKLPSFCDLIGGWNGSYSFDSMILPVYFIPSRVYWEHVPAARATVTQFDVKVKHVHAMLLDQAMYYNATVVPLPCRMPLSRFTLPPPERCDADDHS